MYDLEMLGEMGYCSGIENYSRHMDRRQPGQTPWTLLDYFPDDFVLFVDESPITLPQIRGMFQRRSLAQSTVRLWLPAALGARQPATQVRRIRAACPPGDLCLGHAWAL